MSGAQRRPHVGRVVALSAVVYAIWLFAAAAPADNEPARESAIGRRVTDVSLPRVGGDAASLGSLAGPRLTVLAFLSAECPMSNAYLESLHATATELHERGVRVVVINPNRQENDEQVARHATEFGVKLPVLRDPNLAVADAVGAKVTPEVFVLDADRVVRYRGRIDDQYLSRLKRREQVTRNDLREAIDELLAGKPVTRPETEALGCPIARPVAKSKNALAGVTFNRDVMKILQDRCQNCHRPGQAAPFSLMNYQQAVKWAADIERVTSEHVMPPWKPVAGFGSFRDEQRMTDAEIATVVAWIKAGMPEGAAGDLPAPRDFAADGWILGEPDLVLTMPGEFAVHGSGRDIIRHFVIPTDLSEDKWVTAVEFHAGNSRVAHHAIFFTDTSGSARRMDEADPQPGFGRGAFFVNNIGAWAVGSQPNPLPDGVGTRLPRGADVVLQMHYHPSGRPEKDRSSLGVYFAKKPVEKQLAGLPIFGMRFIWPEGEDRIKTTGKFVVPVDTHAVSVFPHMHTLGKEFKMTATRPDGSVENLIRIDDWDFNWQQFYFYKQPVPLPKGTVIELESYADNSPGNLSNPNSPPKTVTFGEQTTNEMCIGFIGCTVDDDSEFRELLPFRGRLRQRAAENRRP